MSSPPRTLRASLAIALLGGLVGWLWDPVPQVPRTLVVELSGQPQDTCELFYAPDAIFVAEKRITRPYGSRAVLTFPLPPDALALRLDPGSSPNVYRIHAVALTVGSGVFSQTTTWKGKALADIAHAPSSATLKLEGDDLAVYSQGLDPFFQLRVAAPGWTGMLPAIPRMLFGVLGGLLLGLLLARTKLLDLTDERFATLLRWLLIPFALAAIAPFLWTRFPPLIDSGLHAAAAAVWHHIRDPEWHFREYYQLSVGLAPYAAYYGAVHLLGYLVGVEPAARIFVFAAALGVPALSWLLLRELDRPRTTAVLSFALIYTFSFNSGFIAFCVGVNLALAGWILFLRTLKQPTPGRWLLGAMLGVTTYFFHILAWGIWGAGMLLFGALALRERGWRRVFMPWLAAVPSVVAGAWVTMRGTKLHMGNVGALHFKHTDWRYDLSQFFEWTWDACTNDASKTVGTVFTLAATLLALVGLRRLRGVQWGLPLLAVFCGACYFVMPRSVVSPGYWWGINVRFAVPCVLLVCLSIGELRTLASRTLFAACLLSGAWLLVDANRHWWGTREKALAFERIAKIPNQGDRVFFLMHQPHHDEHYKVPYKRYTFAGYYQAMRGGFLAWNFDDGFPLRYKQRFPGPPFNIPNFRWDRHARYYDYLLDLGGNGAELAGHEHEVKKLDQGGGWTLWKLPGPRDDTPPLPPYPSDPSFW